MAIEKGDLILASDVTEINYASSIPNGEVVYRALFEDRDKTVNYIYSFPPRHKITMSPIYFVSPSGTNITLTYFVRNFGTTDWTYVGTVGNSTVTLINIESSFKEFRVEANINVPAALLGGGDAVEYRLDFYFYSEPESALAGETIRVMNAERNAWSNVGSSIIDIKAYNEGRLGYA